MHKKLILSFITFLLTVLICTAALSSQNNTQSDKNRKQTWSSDKLHAAESYAGEIGTAAVLVLHQGRTVFSYGDITYKYMCHSIRKPFLGSLYGIYIERRVIDIHATLNELHIDDIPPSLTSAEKRASIHDLLLSRSGVYHEAAGEAQSMIDTRPDRGSHDPGAFFYYNNWDFNVLGTIFEQTTAKGIFNAFYEEIAKPIGMEDFSPDDCSYVFERSKSSHPAYFFRMSTRDMARFGLLYQQLGRWNGKQVVPEKWIRKSTAVYPVANPGGDFYGYLWRIIPEEAGLGYGFYHTGFGVHLLAVLPDQELVLVHRVDTDRDFDITWMEIKKLMGMILAANKSIAYHAN